MKSPIRLFGLMAAVAAAAVTGVPAQAASSEDGGGGHAVFVQANSADGNAIAAYHRNGDGTLTFRASYSTGGLGGRATGAGSDPLASQGSLTFIRDSGMLLAVNAGSDTISVFQVDGDRLHRTQVLPSGGPFPVGFAVHNDLVYVLDAGGDGFVSGFRIDEGRLSPIDDSTRALGLGNTATPPFLADPAQVGFTPDGDHLIVTTKTHNTVDVFSVGENGRPSAAPVKNAEGPVPFAFDFVAGRLVLSLAGISSLQTFTVNSDNTITPVSAAVGDTQGGLCWAIRARGFEYVSNTGSGSVSQFRVSGNGNVTLVSAIAAPGILGATDSVAADGQFLYVQSGLSSSVYAFRIGSGGALTPIQIAAVPDGDDQEGIAAN